jgi:MoxR-like ATPase
MPLPEKDYIIPGPLWWALDASGAERSVPSRLGRSSNPLDFQPSNRDYKDNGWLILIDEIDKADADVPNGLLDVLASQRFIPYGLNEPVILTGVPPLIVFTTNEDRTLPPAFIRRCVVLVLKLDEDDESLIKALIKRGEGHFPNASQELLRKAARLLCEDRTAALAANLRPLPGQAEYLDLLRIVVGLADREL